MKPTDFLRKVSESTALGPSPTFSELHLAKALEKICERGPIGRASLSRAVGLGEGATRTLLDHMKRAELVDTSKFGSELTETGLELHRRLYSEVKAKKEVPPSEITVGERNFVFHIGGGANFITSGVLQRDQAVRAGARGAVVIVFRNGHLFLPPDETPLYDRWQEVSEGITTEFKPEEGDVLIISGADSIEDAEMGARAAALTLLDC
ncbi:MAG: DUF4443 domain-containing protein [Candidatus Geothermarchaeales archaeon]